MVLLRSWPVRGEVTVPLCSTMNLDKTSSSIFHLLFTITPAVFPEFYVTTKDFVTFCGEAPRLVFHVVFILEGFKIPQCKEY